MATRQVVGGVSRFSPLQNDSELQHLGVFAIDTHNSRAVRAGPHSRDAWVLVSKASKRNQSSFIYAMILHVALSRLHWHRFMPETGLSSRFVWQDSVRPQIWTIFCVTAELVFTFHLRSHGRLYSRIANIDILLIFAAERWPQIREGGGSEATSGFWHNAFSHNWGHIWGTEGILRCQSVGEGMGRFHGIGGFHIQGIPCFLQPILEWIIDVGYESSGMCKFV